MAEKEFSLGKHMVKAAAAGLICVGIEAGAFAVQPLQTGEVEDAHNQTQTVQTPTDIFVEISTLTASGGAGFMIYYLGLPMLWFAQEEWKKRKTRGIS
jgi:hypothetical protein